MNAKHEITICLGSSCFSRGSREILKTIKSYLKDRGLEEKVFFHGQLCSGRCEKGPNMKIDDVDYHEVSEENVTDLLDEIFG
ncbi:MAG: (2Fe-2S) ferredoxin domain-containing protein [Chlorobi bacterium]|nr:(2Fe-2S) ferredoxin domain-containing protein [Chlorobiota bacterium]